ncbi:hypothetical protein [Undibacterium curvum]|uniref:Uncharacterized protein n=1 Tax=Undibacterium curvum TaxID=2762294 RepID=A0ABR7A4Y3_9BURK|nr:hypothetical protein [Undibacterium curvum]MBC3931968.1 hypothetical protein [Undibacterium curvum]
MSGKELAEAAGKEALKQALKEWLDEKLAEFGWWSLKMLAAGALVAGVYFYLIATGWHK